MPSPSPSPRRSPMFPPPLSLLPLLQQYNPELDREQFEAEIKQYALTTNSAGVGQMKRMSLADPEIMHMDDKASPPYE